MGSYLSEPVCEKISSDESNDKLDYGASSMQGWRLSQEDAHNSILDFDTNSSFFAVYDGHGGHEVAEYCAKKLPNFLKVLNTYKSGEIEKALVKAFLGFDATIISAEVVAELRQIASSKPQNEEESEDEDEENVSQLNQEAVMPLEEVMEKYTAVGKLAVAALKESAGKQPVSPFLKARKTKDVAGSSGSTSGLAGSSKNPVNDDKICAKNSKSDHDGLKEDDAQSDSKKPKEEVVTTSCTTTGSKNKEIISEHETNGLEIPAVKVTEPDIIKDTIETSKVEAETKDVIAEEHQNGEVETPENKCGAKTEKNAHTVQENGDVSKKGKGKALAKTKGVCPAMEKKSRPKRTSQQMYRKLLEFEDESADSDDDEDETFTVMDDTSDDSEQDISNTAIDVEHSSDEKARKSKPPRFMKFLRNKSSHFIQKCHELFKNDGFDEEDADDEEDLDYEDDGEDEEDDGESEVFMNNMKSGPGSDSGCTAVVALLVGNELYVANAGDSRCIICRDGKAVEMSFDHKPEDAPERARVLKAGGRVTCDGRINNGLNLSRAIGDHAYKLNGELSDREQMITALPDVKRLTIDPARDEFMVLACDGIWNYMSSEEVVEFVRNRFESEDRPIKLSTICEEMFDHCLAPDTLGDGTGCDNMTCIIVEFKASLADVAATPAPVGTLKRASSPHPDEPSKRSKTDLPSSESPSNVVEGTTSAEITAGTV